MFRITGIYSKYYVYRGGIQNRKKKCGKGVGEAQSGLIFQPFFKMCKMCVKWSNSSRNSKKICSKIGHPTFFEPHTRMLGG